MLVQDCINIDGRSLRSSSRPANRFRAGTIRSIVVSRARPVAPSKNVKVFLTQLRPYGHDFGKNLDLIKRQIDKARLEFSSEDILLLPELFGCDSDKTLYENSVSELARNLPLHLVSGSHHEERGSGRARLDMRRVLVFRGLLESTKSRTRSNSGAHVLDQLACRSPCGPIALEKHGGIESLRVQRLCRN